MDTITMKLYCGFNSDKLNSNQPLPKKCSVIYRTTSQSMADDLAIRIRNKYGINIWLDGTVCTGWKILVHKGDKNRAINMLKNIL